MALYRGLTVLALNSIEADCTSRAKNVHSEDVEAALCRSKQQDRIKPLPSPIIPARILPFSLTANLLRKFFLRLNLI
jgi:hypothetical protein